MAKFYLTILAAVFFLVVAACPHVSRAQTAKPNILLINVDDLDSELFEIGCATQVFPNLKKLASEGIKFTNCHAASPLCGPSRASLLTGLYVHRHGFRVHDPESKIANGFDGGFRQYIADTDTSSVDWTRNDISRKLQSAGYRTMLVGKYLHDGFAPKPHQNWSDVRPSGWDDFYCTLGGRYFGATQYLSRRNGEYREEVRNLSKFRIDEYPNQDWNHLYSRYRTNVEFVDAISLIQQHRDRRPSQPFFMYLAPFAPHLPADGSMLDNRYQFWWRNLLQPRAADYGVAAGVGKPEVLTRMGPLTETEVEKGNQQYRERFLAMKSFDDMLGLLLQRLQLDGTLDETIIVFTSDNGYMEGHQRHFGKQLPYDRCTRVPLLVWGPSQWVGNAKKRNHLVSHVDLAATLLDLAQAPQLAATDGQSLISLIDPSATLPSEDSWRPQGVLSEHYQRLGHAWQDIEGVYISLRTKDERLTQWGDGLKEFYHLQEDPFELSNGFESLNGAERNLFSTLLNSNLLGDDFVTTVGSPEKNFQVFRGQEFSGYAISPKRVKEVRLVFRRIGPSGQPEFLDGQQWGTNYAQNQAELTGQSQTISRWKFNFHPEGDGQYPVTMTARAYGQDGTYQNSIAVRQFEIEHQSPGTSIDWNTGAQISFDEMNDVSISGTAKGEKDIREVRLVLKDLATGKYFDGIQWTTSYRYVLANLQTYGDPTYRTWNYSLPAELTADRIYMSARAYQIDGQYDQTIPWVVLLKN